MAGQIPHSIVPLRRYPHSNSVQKMKTRLIYSIIIALTIFLSAGCWSTSSSSLENPPVSASEESPALESSDVETLAKTSETPELVEAEKEVTETEELGEPMSSEPAPVQAQVEEEPPAPPAEPEVVETPEEMQTQMEDDDLGDEISAMSETEGDVYNQETIIEAPRMEDAQALIIPQLETIYFDYDDTTVKDKFKESLMDNLRWLEAHPEVRVVVAGHADERGSNEYNLALGEARSNAIVDYLKSLGANGAQFQTVSYGEERPAVGGHDAEAYAKNRRVEFSYNK